MTTSRFMSTPFFEIAEKSVALLGFGRFGTRTHAQACVSRSLSGRQTGKLVGARSDLTRTCSHQMRFRSAAGRSTRTHA
jgi:hypothetical protein